MRSAVTVSGGRSPFSFDEGRWLYRTHEDPEMNENALGILVVDWAVELHRDLGPRLLETVYEVPLAPALEPRA